MEPPALHDLLIGGFDDVVDENSKETWNRVRAGFAESVENAQNARLVPVAWPDQSMARYDCTAPMPLEQVMLVAISTLMDCSPAGQFASGRVGSTDESPHHHCWIGRLPDAVSALRCQACCISLPG